MASDDPRRFTRTQITLYVLTEEPLPDDIELDTIIEWCDTGPAVLDELHRAADTLTGKQMAEALYHAGSDPGFFSLDDAGNRTDADTYIVYAIPKDEANDMTEGRGIEVRSFGNLDSAENYAAEQSSPDNPNRYEVRPEE